MHRGLVAQPFELLVGNCVMKVLRVRQIHAHAHAHVAFLLCKRCHCRYRRKSMVVVSRGLVRPTTGGSVPSRPGVRRPATLLLPSQLLLPSKYTSMEYPVKSSMEDEVSRRQLREAGQVPEHATVDGDRDPGDVARLVGGEERHGVRDVLWGTDSRHQI